MSMTNPKETMKALHTAADFLKQRLGEVPRRAIILGSGLGRFGETLRDTTVIPYGEIPGFPQTGVVGHRGALISGRCGDTPVIAMSGRFHMYEGHPLSTVVFPARTLAMAGVRTLIITNAAGGVNEAFRPGDLMRIRDHINFTGRNPLEGDNLDDLGARFPDMSQVYSPRLGKLMFDLAREQGLDLKEGVYVWMTGPSYETPAEVRMARIVGGDAVGMSTVPEAIAANHIVFKNEDGKEERVEIGGISLITNMASGILPQPLTHEEVTETANEASERFTKLVTALMQRI